MQGKAEKERSAILGGEKLLSVQERKKILAKNKKNTTRSAADRMAAAATKTYTKVKPRVVRHVLDNQVLSIYQPGTHQLKEQQPQYMQLGNAPSSCNLRQTAPETPQRVGLQSTIDQAASPPYGSTYMAALNQPAFVETQNQLHQLHNGVNGLAQAYLGHTENDDPNALLALQQIRSRCAGHSGVKPLGQEPQIDYDERSIQLGLKYSTSAIGEMNLTELDQLGDKNSERVQQIKAQYEIRREGVKSYADVVHEQKDNWSTKLVNKESVESYPTYGRGLTPNMSMNTFMMQDPVKPMDPEQEKLARRERTSPIPDRYAKNRMRIISPKRKQFETKFINVLKNQKVHQPIADIEYEKERKLTKPEFDRLTKPESHNQKMKENIEIQNNIQEHRRQQARERTLGHIEKDAEVLINKEVEVCLSQDMLDNLKRVFTNSKEEGKEDLDTVPMDTYFMNIVEDDWFDDVRLENIVRETVDGEQESLDFLMTRFSEQYPNEPLTPITFLEFITLFCRRGVLREGEELVFTGRGIVKTKEVVPDPQDPEVMYENLSKDFKNMVIQKQNRVPKSGKGKFNITVPELFDFQKADRLHKSPSIRAQKLDADLRAKQMEEMMHTTSTYRANKLPKSTMQPRFQNLQVKDMERRRRIKEESMAKTKQTESPFTFYERDRKNQQDDQLQDELACEVTDHMADQFRARIIPWRILVPKFEFMMQKEEHDREQRIKRNAEKAFNLAKLPPRMQEHEDELRRRKEENLDSTQGDISEAPLYDFRPQRARSVPDFRKLQKEFVTQMEQRKKGVQPTIPKPFKFHEPKPNARLRGHMDQANQNKNPTLKSRASRLNRDLELRDEKVEQPASTKKHEAYMEKRRSQMENAREKKQLKAQEEHERIWKQKRLTQRVKCSPALVNNASVLKKNRLEAIAKAKRELSNKEKTYEQIKAGIEFNVANRPLLVEQVSNAFIHNLNQIKELQRYVTILREAGMDPDTHLTEEQRELLVSADYYDRLNAATAYFPSAQLRSNDQNMQHIEEEQHDMEQEDDDGEGDASDQGEGQIQGDEDDEDQEEQDYTQENNQMLIQQQEEEEDLQDQRESQLQMQDDEDQELDEGESDEDGQMGEDMEMVVDEPGDEDEMEYEDEDGHPIDDEEGVHDDDQDELDGQGEELMDEGEMMGEEQEGEADEDDDMIEIDQEQLRQLLLQHHQQQHGEGQEGEDEDGVIEIDQQQYEAYIRQLQQQNQINQQNIEYQRRQ